MTNRNCSWVLASGGGQNHKNFHLSAIVAKKVSSMDVTGNILYLLSSKMNGQSTYIQSALKIAACFGIKIKASVVATLGTAHTDLRDKLEQAVKEDFMVMVGTSDFKFVHDKVREAAYSLIPENEKNQVSLVVKWLYNKVYIT
jgi:predicted ATPase